MNVKLIEELISEKMGLVDFYKERYSEPHRFYHTWEHVLDLIDKAIDDKELSDELLLAIVFHDIVYDPMNNDNEEKSAELFKTFFNYPDVYEAILATKNHIDVNPTSKLLNKYDLSVLYGDFNSFMKYEDGIFKEYQFVDVKTYTENRIKFLEKHFGNIKQEYLDYIKYRKYNIGVYAGSFNPFHVGHYDILKKAEAIFDKVIIARGINTSKSDELLPLTNTLKNRQAGLYTGLLTDFIDGLGYDVTLIRGLRNASDLEFEKTQYRYLKDLKPDIKVINILSDSEFEHVSSSSIKMLQKYGKGDKYLI